MSLTGKSVVSSLSCSSTRAEGHVLLPAPPLAVSAADRRSCMFLSLRGVCGWGHVQRWMGCGSTLTWGQ